MINRNDMRHEFSSVDMEEWTGSGARSDYDGRGDESAPPGLPAGGHPHISITEQNFVN
ncbi:MAG TPA: hypothetical protein VFG50_06940 [Rhodothermales bacterium]|nr:hypothetical protein [Rhodothermales bacterium]